MYNINVKYKRFLFFLINLSIVIGSLYFIYDKTVLSNSDDLNKFIQQIQVNLLTHSWIFLLLIFLSILKWLLKILKWKTLVSYVKNISFYKATQQCISSSTASFFMIDTIKDYEVKAVYYKKDKRKIALLNIMGNLHQVIITIIFGSIGLIYFLSTYEVEINPYRIRRVGYLIGFIILMNLGKKRIQLFGFYSWKKIFNFIRNLGVAIHIKTLFYSIVKYSIIVSQFYFILLIFDVNQDFFSIINLIFTLYFITLFIPSIPLFDWAIKGTVAIFIFSYISIDELTIITTTLLMWISNFVLPYIIGIFASLNSKL